MTLVLDASSTLGWFFEDERDAASDAVLDEVVKAGAVVPGLWRLEVASGLQAAIRRKRIDQAYCDSAIRRLGALAITIDEETNRFAWTAILQLARRFGLTPYDAAYLELAQRHALPLATLDKELRTAAMASGVRLL